MTENIQNRKRDHLSLCATEDVSYKNKTTLFEDMDLVHSALPETSLDDICLNRSFAGKTLNAPLIIGAMTGGTGDNSTFNQDLASVAEELNIGICLGSLRPGLENSSLVKEFQVRTSAPTTLVFANIGGAQLNQYEPQKIIDTAKSLGADGLMIHLNPAMEIIQPGGDTNFNGVIDALAALVQKDPEFPIIPKETGMGLSFQDGEKLKKIGITCVEIAGAGGTSWVGVETLRAEGMKQKMGSLLWDFGIPTAASTAWMVDLEFDVVASGGVYSGLDMAKAVALGAKLTAVARPLVIAYNNGQTKAVKSTLEEMISGLRYVMMCCGTKNLEALRNVPRVIGPRLTKYIESGWHTR